MMNSEVKAIVDRIEERLIELRQPEVSQQLLLENVSKLYAYAQDLQPHNHWKEVKRGQNVLLKGFKNLTVGTRLSDRLHLAKYEIQGNKDDIILAYKKFLRVMKKFDFKLSDEAYRLN